MYLIIVFTESTSYWYARVPDSRSSGLQVKCEVPVIPFRLCCPFLHSISCSQWKTLGIDTVWRSYLCALTEESLRK